MNEIREALSGLVALIDAEFPPPLFAAQRSSGWPKVRADFLKTNPACAACGGTKNLEVHHVRPYHLFPESELDPDNLIALCDRPGRNCHFVFGHFWDWSDYNPNVIEHTASIRTARTMTKEEKK